MRYIGVRRRVVGGGGEMAGKGEWASVEGEGGREVGESGGGWGRREWVITKGIIFLFLRLYPLKCAKICVRDTLRLSRSRLFEDCRVFAHGVIKILSRRMREDTKTRKR